MVFKSELREITIAKQNSHKFGYGYTFEYTGHSVQVNVLTVLRL